MCDPVSIGVALTVASTLATAGSQIYAGQAAYQQGKYENQVAQQNAQLEEASKADAFSRRNVDQMRLWRKVSQQLGEQRAAGAASGVDVNFGSALSMQEDTQMIGGEDSTTLNENYNKEIKGYDIDAANYKAQGAAALMRGKAARTGSYMQATGTLLAGASQIAKGPSFGPKAAH